MSEETSVKQEQKVSTESKCPFNHKASAPSNRDWWPNQLNLQVLHQQSALSDPMGEEFDYAKEFKSLDLHAVIKDLHVAMTDSQDWRGIVQERIASATAAAAPERGSSVLRR
jgi:catalase (peroxidase I)